MAQHYRGDFRCDVAPQNALGETPMLYLDRSKFSARQIGGCSRWGAERGLASCKSLKKLPNIDVNGPWFVTQTPSFVVVPTVGEGVGAASFADAWHLSPIPFPDGLDISGPACPGHLLP